MRSVGIKVLNNRLSEYVRLAASGETVLGESKGTLLTYWNNFVSASEFWLAE